MDNQLQHSELNMGEVLVIVPVFHPIYLSKIVKTDRSIVYNKRAPLNIVKEACLEFGCDFQGRIKGFKKMIKKNQYQIPIIVNQRPNVVMQPTMSYKNEKCVWINAINIIKDRSIEHTDGAFHIQTAEGDMKIACKDSIYSKMNENMNKINWWLF